MAAETLEATLNGRAGARRFHQSWALDLCGRSFRRKTKLRVNRKLFWGSTAPAAS